MPRWPKKKLLNQSLNLAEFLSKYDYKSLSGALSTFENQLGYDLLNSFIHYKQRAFEVTALDMAGMTGKDKEAAFASGYAKACEDIADHFIQELRDAVLGRTGVIENPRPEENVPDVN